MRSFLISDHLSQFPNGVYHIPLHDQILSSRINHAMVLIFSCTYILCVFLNLILCHFYVIVFLIFQIENEQMKKTLKEYEEKFTKNEILLKELKENLSIAEKNQADSENFYVSLLM